jgi:hypothetical protein
MLNILLFLTDEVESTVEISVPVDSYQIKINASDVYTYTPNKSSFVTTL